MIPNLDFVNSLTLVLAVVAASSLASVRFDVTLAKALCGQSMYVWYDNVGA